MIEKNEMSKCMYIVFEVKKNILRNWRGVKYGGEM